MMTFGGRDSTYRGDRNAPLGIAIASLAVLLSLSGQRGHAEEATPPAGEPQPAATGTASKLEEIVVTSNKLGANLETTPVAATAINAETMAQEHIQTTEDVAIRVPSLVYDSPSAFAEAYIRGIGSNFSLAGLESSVATYVDGVYLQRQVGANLNLVDVHDVQVLKGPQGTLYGRNATGGAILLTTNDPTDELGGSISGEYGRFDHGKVTAVLNVPVDSTLAFRFAAQKETDGAWASDTADHGETGGGRDTYLRAKIRWQPIPEFTAIYGVEYNDFRTTANVQQEILPTPLCLVCAIYHIPQVYPGFYAQTQSADTYQRVQFVAHTLRLDYENELFSLNSVTGYRMQSSPYRNDQEFEPPEFLAASVRETGPTLTNDTYLRTKLDGPVNFLVGESVERERDRQDVDLDGAALGPFSPATSTDLVAIDSVSAYAEATYKFTPEVSLTGGARYNQDDKTIDIFNQPNAQIAFAGPPYLRLNDTFRAVTPRVVLSYDGDWGYYYVSYNRGAKSGGFPSPSFAPTAPVQSEILDSYEVGAKNSFLGGRLKTDGDVFVGKYTNIQVQLVNAASGTVTLQNAGAADLFGVEYNARFHLDDHWRFDGGVTYLHSKFTEYANAAVFAPNPAGIGLVNATEDLSGSVLPRSPKWTLFFAPDFSYDLEGGWTTETSVIAHCTTSYDFTADAGGPLNSDRQGAYATIDATFTVTTPDGKADLSLYGTNITATHYREFAQTAAYGAFYVPGAPRSYGVRATYRF